MNHGMVLENGVVVNVTVSSVPTSSASGLKISNGPLVGPPNPFSSSFTTSSQTSKSCRYFCMNYLLESFGISYEQSP